MERNETTDSLIRIEERLARIEEDVKEIKEDQRQNYSTKSDLRMVVKEQADQDKRIKKIEDGIAKVVWTIVLAVLSGLLYLVIRINGV